MSRVLAFVVLAGIAVAPGCITQRRSDSVAEARAEVQRLGDIEDDAEFFRELSASLTRIGLKPIVRFGKSVPLRHGYLLMLPAGMGEPTRFRKGASENDAQRTAPFCVFVTKDGIGDVTPEAAALEDALIVTGFSSGKIAILDVAAGTVSFIGGE